RAREAIEACGCASMPVRWQLAAARPSAGSKRDLFEALLTHRRATDEAIVGALGLLNHPAHAALTAPLLAPALQALPDLHRRRKIFFVNRWIDAFVGGQGSERASRIVERAIARAGLDDPLRRRLEQARHELARVIAVRSRWANSAAPGLNAGTGTTRSARTARPPSG